MEVTVIRFKKKGWIMVMAFLSWAELLAGCEKWPGHGTPKESQDNPVEITTGTPVAITDIQEISFWERGSVVPLVSDATLTREEAGTRVWLELQYQDEYEQMMDAALMDQAREILERYEVGNWNGFRGSDSMVLDGSSFSFHVSFTDGTSLSASGTNAFPKNQKKVFSELSTLIDPAVEQWCQEQHPNTVKELQNQ